MERRRGHRQVEAGVGQVGGFEVGTDHPQPLAAEVGLQMGGKIGSGFHRDHVRAPGEEFSGRQARPSADLHHSRASPETTPVGQQIKNPVRVRRSRRPVVASAVVERPPAALVLSITHNSHGSRLPCPEASSVGGHQRQGRCSVRRTCG
jgi:hypothetical protein